MSSASSKSSDRPECPPGCTLYPIQNEHVPYADWFYHRLSPANRAFVLAIVECLAGQPADASHLPSRVKRPHRPASSVSLPLRLVSGGLRVLAGARGSRRSDD